MNDDKMKDKIERYVTTVTVSNHEDSMDSISNLHWPSCLSQICQLLSDIGKVSQYHEDSMDFIGNLHWPSFLSQI